MAFSPRHVVRSSDQSNTKDFDSCPQDTTFEIPGHGYHIATGIIGVGTFSTVYETRNIETNCVRALKKISWKRCVEKYDDQEVAAERAFANEVLAMQTMTSAGGADNVLPQYVTSWR
eukprot:PhM_4_TR1231/c0_g1_i1/m.76869